MVEVHLSNQGRILNPRRQAPWFIVSVAALAKQRTSSIPYFHPRTTVHCPSRQTQLSPVWADYAVAGNRPEKV